MKYYASWLHVLLPDDEKLKLDSKMGQIYTYFDLISTESYNLLLQQNNVFMSCKFTLKEQCYAFKSSKIVPLMSPGPFEIRSNVLIIFYKLSYTGCS